MILIVTSISCKCLYWYRRTADLSKYKHIYFILIYYKYQEIEPPKVARIMMISFIIQKY